MIGEMNCLITIESVEIAQTADGDIVKRRPDKVWKKWGKIEQNSGNLLISHGMINFTESYTVEMWYEPTRPTKANYILTYNGKTMKVYNVRLDNEGNRMIETLTCFTSN